MNLESVLAWYIELAKKPGWKEYVWHQVKAMARDHPTAYADLPDLLTKAMKESSDAKP